jgi:O-antigen/teichoic acid export membrane protein
MRASTSTKHIDGRSRLSAAHNTSLVLIGQLLVFAQGLVLTPVVIKVSSPETYGAYILLLSYVSIMFGISSMGVGISAKRWLPSAERVDRAERFYPQCWFQMISVTLLGGVSAFVYQNLDFPSQWKFTGFSGWIVPLYLLAYTAYSQGADYFRYTHRVVIFNVATVVQPYLFISLALGTYWTTTVLNAGSLMAALTIASALTGILLFIRIYREIGIKFQGFKRQELSKEIRLGFPLVLAYLVDVILSVGDRYIIAAMLSVKDVGLYSPAYLIGSLAMVLPKVFGIVLPPLISQLIDKGDAVAAKNLSDNAVRIFLAVSIPYVVGAAIIGQEVLRLYANDEVAEAAWPVIPIAATASIFYGLMLIRTNIVFVRLKTSSLFHINLICAVVNIVLNIVLIHLFEHIIVAAFATLTTYLLCFQLLGRQLKGDPINPSINVGEIARILACSLGVAFAMVLVTSIPNLNGATAVGLSIIVGGATYLALIFVQPSNRAAIVQMAKSVRS